MLGAEGDEGDAAAGASKEAYSPRGGPYCNLGLLGGPRGAPGCWVGSVTAFRESSVSSRGP